VSKSSVKIKWEAKEIHDSLIEVIITLIDSQENGIVEHCERHNIITRVYDKMGVIYDFKFACPECYKEFNDAFKEE
jgi:hypothetical protein